MTREKAIEQAKELLEEATRCENSVSYVTSDDEEWLKMAIKALEQESTTKENLVVEDCMKREFIEIVVNYPSADLCTYPEYKGKPYYSILYRDEDSRNHVGFGTYKIEMLSQWIKQYFMSDIQPKTGHWVSKHIVDDCNGVVTWYECSECGRSVDETITEEFMLKDYPYCHCGAKMIPTDSNCDSCKYRNEVDGSNCYECVKGIRNNYKAESEE